MASTKKKNSLTWCRFMAYNITPSVLEECLLTKNKELTVDWSIVCLSEQIPESYWEENMNRFSSCIVWTALARNKKLSSAFWKKYIHHLPFLYDLYTNPNLKDDFWLDMLKPLSKEIKEDDTESLRLKKIQEKIDIYTIADCAPHLTEAFYRKIDVLPNIMYLIWNKNISEKFFKEKYGHNEYSIQQLKDRVLKIEN